MTTVDGRSSFEASIGAVASWPATKTSSSARGAVRAGARAGRADSGVFGRNAFAPSAQSATKSLGIITRTV